MTDIRRAVIVLRADCDGQPQQWGIHEVFSHCAYMRGPFDSREQAEAEMRRRNEQDAQEPTDG